MLGPPGAVGTITVQPAELLGTGRVVAARPSERLERSSIAAPTRSWRLQTIEAIAARGEAEFVAACRDFIDAAREIVGVSLLESTRRAAYAR